MSDPARDLAGKTGIERRRGVRALFDAIAPRYDLLNHLLSLGLDHYWRRRALHLLAPEPGRSYLDLACGTGDLGLLLATLVKTRVVGVDISPAMLRKIAPKKARKKPAGAFYFLQGDALQLPFAAGSFDGVSLAFGLRNFPRRNTALREIHRVLKPAGVLVILEFVPAAGFRRSLFRLYFRHLLPFLGKIVSRHSFAYDYLPASVETFATAADLTAELAAAGFREIRTVRPFPGVAVAFRAVRDSSSEQPVPPV